MVVQEEIMIFGIGKLIGVIDISKRLTHTHILVAYSIMKIMKHYASYFLIYVSILMNIILMVFDLMV
jgi:hypothetical protein